MRFGVPDSDDEDLVSLASLTSEDESVNAAGPSEPRAPRSALGKTIHAYIDSSESEAGAELDSEDEVDLLGGGFEVVEKSKSWREKPVRSTSSPMIATRSVPNATAKTLAFKGKGRAQDLLRPDDSPTRYDLWLREAEEAAFLDGRRAAQERRGVLKEVALNARAELREQQAMTAAQEAGELRRLLEGMRIRQTEEEAETTRRFAERERKLWADIDSAIRAVERAVAEKKAAREFAEREQKKAEEARLAAEETQALAKKAEAERAAKEAAEREQAARDHLAAERKKAEEAKAAAEAKKAKVAESGVTAREWEAWVDKQKWMKREVIEVVKGSREVKTKLRVGMRLMTRGLGQIVNTRETIVRVTEDIERILNEQLSSRPTANSPVVLSHNPPPAYTYLLSHLSKALIKQAENEIAAKADAAFPLARVAVGLLLRGHAAFGEVLFARIVKKCPWAVPHYPSRRIDQSREEYEKHTGRGSDEGLGDYITRMSGILTLYFAILQTSLSSVIPTLPSQPTPDELIALFSHSLRLPAAWTWVSNMLRDPLVGLPAAATVLRTWLLIAAPELMRVYGREQVGKILAAMKEEGIDGGKIKAETESERQKLALSLERWREVGYPEGRDWE